MLVTMIGLVISDPKSRTTLLQKVLGSAIRQTENYRKVMMMPRCSLVKLDLEIGEVPNLDFTTTTCWPRDTFPFHIIVIPELKVLTISVF